ETLRPVVSNHRSGVLTVVAPFAFVCSRNIFMSPLPRPISPPPRRRQIVAADKNICPRQSLLPGRAKGIQRAGAVRAIKEHLTKASGVRKVPGLRASTGTLRPANRLWVFGVARAHHHVMSERNQLRGDRISDHSSSQHSDLH